MSDLLEKVRAIQAEKNAKILPENIKKDVQIFDVVGTLEELDTSDATATAEDIAEGKTAYVNGEKIEGTKEDVSEVIMAQEEIISQLQVAVQNKTGGPASLNIFMQEDEPSIKDGIWLKTNDSIPYIFGKYNFNPNISIDLNSYQQFAKESYQYIDNVYYTIVSAINVQDNIYILGENNSKSYIILLNTTTNDYSLLAEVPTYLRTNQSKGGTPEIVYLNGYLYLINGINDYPSYKMNISTLAFTEIQSFDCAQHFEVIVAENRIFTFGGWNGADAGKVCEYDIENNNWITRFTSSGNMSGIGSVIYYNNKFYIFGVASGYDMRRLTILDYDSVNNTFIYVKTLNSPNNYSFSSSTQVLINDKIYIFGLYGQNIYYFDTTTEEFTDTNVDVPYNWTPISGRKHLTLLTASNGLYLFSNAGYMKYIVNYPQIAGLVFDEDTLVINQKSGTYSTLLGNNKTPILLFDDIKVFKDKAVETYEIYYGEGEQWIQLH